MTMKIQNAMPSGRVIFQSSREHYPENVERQFDEQERQIQQRQRQYQFHGHENPPLRAGSEVETRSEPAPVRDAIIERPDQHDHVDDQEPAIDASMAGLNVAAAVALHV